MPAACVTCQAGDVEHSFPCGNTALDFVGTLKARRNEAPRETLAALRLLQALEEPVVPTIPIGWRRDWPGS